MLELKRKLLSVALASATLMFAASLRAQDNAQSEEDDSAEAKDARELDEVTVSGIRRGIESAIGVKQEADGIVEAISAEDLGKLPDISIADSIARLPGLAAQRVAGRSSTISIRGLSGDYGTTLLNGREQVSVGDNRTVEFDQFPSELINQVAVYKTADAGVVGQGLSGTIDLRTVRPLQFGESAASVNVRAEKNSLGKLNSDSDDFGSRVSAFYVNQFMDDRLGIALGYARLDSPGQAERWEAWGYPTDISPAQGSRTLGGGKAQASSTSNVRQGLMGVLEFNASDSYATTVDLYYSKFDKTETTRFLETGLGWSGAVLSNPTIQDGVVTAGRFTGVRPVLRNDLNEGDDKLFALGWNNQWTLSDLWTAALDVSYSRADRSESILETYAGTRGALDNVDFRLDPVGPPTLTFSRDYRDPSQLVLTDPGGWGQDGYIKTPQIDDSLRSVRLDFERNFSDGMFSSLEFGFNYSDREKQRQVPEAFVDLLNNRAPVAVASEFLISPVDLSHTGIPGIISYDVNGVLNRYYTLRNNINSDIVNKQWTVDEQVTTLYAQLNISTDLGSVPVRGNIGFQMLDTDQSSDGFSVIQGNAANAVPFVGGSDYRDFLPSANLVFELENENMIRLGLGRQQARPRVDQMRANNNTSLEFTGVNRGLWSRNGGNPELQPWTANSLDVAWEKYFGSRGYVGLAYFYKDLKTYIFDQTGTFDARGLAAPTGYTGPTPNPVGVFSRPANGDGGAIKGFEFSLSIPFDLFSDALEGFGFLGNFSDTSSSIKRLGPDGPDEPIAGLSKQVTNLTFYYENHGFSARFSQRKRSDFLGEIQGFGADRALVNIDGETVLDSQIGYSFGPGTLEGMSVLLQVNNLTNEPYRQFFSETGLTQRSEAYGRQYLLGVTYKF